MTQPELFTVERVAYAKGRPLCHAWDQCKGERGRCVLGPPREDDGWIIRSLTCETCGCTGDLAEVKKA